MFIGFTVDFMLAWRGKIFKTGINNSSIVIETSLFMALMGLFAVYLSRKDDDKNKNDSLLGYGSIVLIVLAFLSIIIFKIKGKKAL